MTVRCPAGHESTETDYCSVCGLAIQPSAPVSTGVSAPSAAGGSSAGAAVCPVCGEPRTDPTARFCEVCRYDFVKGEPGPAPGAAGDPVTIAPPPLDPMPSAPPRDPTPPPPAPIVPDPPLVVAAPVPPLDPDPVAVAPATPTAYWEARIGVDASLDTDPDPSLPAPTDEPEYLFPLDRDETLIGRRDDRQQIHPDIPLRDPGVSRRHAKLLHGADGALSVLDLDSTNGTSVNGDALPPGLRRVLKSGDAITLGRWTRITIRGPQ